MLIGHEAGNGCARARDHADDEPDETGPDDVPPALERDEHAFERVMPVWVLGLRIFAHDHLLLDDDESLRHGEQPDQGRD